MMVEDWTTIGARIRLQIFDECDVADLTPTLRQLCATADACERLARAAVARDDFRRVRAEHTRRVDVGETTTFYYDATRQLAAGTEYDAALAAYREAVARA